MCGICGQVSRKPVEKSIIYSMNNLIKHRGPDNEGVYISKIREWNAGLGHRRLSIIDLSEHGRQPLCNEDRTVWLVANGEIYNYKALEKRLKNLGHFFSSNSDSEVLIHAFEEWGVNCLKEIRGMFAFAIWDQKKESIFLARDICGEKPLFYSITNNAFVFASELPALLCSEYVNKDPDNEAIIEYLHYQVVLSPKTILKSIRKLPPGHFALFQKGKFLVKSYISSVIKPVSGLMNKSCGTCAEMIIETLEKSISSVLISDVPLGIFLSGGLDSTLILSLASKVSSKPLHTFSIGFSHQGFNELSWAQKAADYFGTIHHEEIVDINFDIENTIPKIITRLGEPMADASVIPYYYLSRLAASEVKVVLGGDGADEIFGGYRRHLIRPFLDFFAKIAPFIQRISTLFQADDRYYASSFIETLNLVTQLGIAQKSGYTPWNPLFSIDELRVLLSSDTINFQDSLPLDFLHYLTEIDLPNEKINKMLWIDQMTFLPEDILTKVDRMGMAHSLEVRAPFLYPEIISLAAGIPGKYKIFMGQSKHVLKMAAHGIIPPEILKRKKHGFNVPVDAWFRGKGLALLKDVLLQGSGNSAIRIISQNEITRLIDEHVQRKVNHGRKLWALLVLEMWLKIIT